MYIAKCLFALYGAESVLRLVDIVYVYSFIFFVRVQTDYTSYCEGFSFLVHIVLDMIDIFAHLEFVVLKVYRVYYCYFLLALFMT